MQPKSVHISIVERDPLIWEDMKAALEAHFEGVQITRDASLELLRNTSVQNTLPPDLIIFTGDNRGDIRASQSTQDWLETRAVIAFDLRLPHVPAKWQLLDRPFTDDDLLTAAQQLLIEPSPLPPD